MLMGMYAPRAARLRRPGVQLSGGGERDPEHRLEPGRVVELRDLENAGARCVERHGSPVWTLSVAALSLSDPPTSGSLGKIPRSRSGARALRGSIEDTNSRG